MEEEETMSCLNWLEVYAEHGFNRLIVEGDASNLINKLKSGNIPKSFLGFIIF